VGILKIKNSCGYYLLSKRKGKACISGTTPPVSASYLKGGTKHGYQVKKQKFP